MRHTAHEAKSRAPRSVAGKEVILGLGIGDAKPGVARDDFFNGRAGIELILNPLTSHHRTITAVWLVSVAGTTAFASAGLGK